MDNQPQSTAADEKQRESGRMQLVCFKLADEEYAVEITAVQEVLRLQKITPVPQVPHFVLGVLNIRGEIVPVFDLRKKFGLAEKEPDVQTKIVIVKVYDAVISFIVDKIMDTIKVDVSRIDPSPNVKMKMERDCVKGVGVFDQRMVIILDTEKVHRHINEAIRNYSSPEEQRDSVNG